MDWMQELVEETKIKEDWKRPAQTLNKKNINKKAGETRKYKQHLFLKGELK